MRNVVLTRVDERLIHGQVMTSWLKLCNANVILIIDAGSASNAFLKRILFAAAPKDVELQVMNEADAAAYLKEDSPAGEKVLVLSKTPQPLLAWSEAASRSRRSSSAIWAARPAESTSTRAFPPARTRSRHSVILWTPAYTSTPDGPVRCEGRRQEAVEVNGRSHA